MKFADERPDSTQPHWLDGGQETCGFCCHAYLLEWEYRCVDCDQSVCPLCVVVIAETRAAYCPGCGPQGAER